MTRKYKVVNKIFIDSEHNFSLLKFYYNEIVQLLHRRATDFHDFTDRVETEKRQRHQPFDREFWLKHYDVFSEYYPNIFMNSFIISAWALFESQVKKIFELVKEEHKIPLEWDDLEGGVPQRVKRFLSISGIVIRDDPPKIVLSPPDFVPPKVFDENRFIASELWHDLENCYRIRNCITHHGGIISRMRYQKHISEYALTKKILIQSKDQKELKVNHEFNREVCDIMMKFFSNLKGAYYSMPLPED